MPAPSSGPDDPGHPRSLAQSLPRPLPRGVSLLTRRRFLAFSGVTAAGALAAGATQVSWDRLVSAAATTPLDSEAGVLVVVTLYGGNDG